MALSEVAIQARAPAELAEALEREAARRMISKSAIVREALVYALGLDQGAGADLRQARAGAPRQEVAE